MSFDKHYPNRKDIRRKYYRRKNPGCRCHGKCSYCRDDRLHSVSVRKDAGDREVRDYMSER